MTNSILIDLDGTVYPHDNGIWGAISIRMNQYMHNELGIPEVKVPVLRNKFFEQYGTTLRGLQSRYEVDADEYLAYVHDIPVEKYLNPDNELRKVLGSINQKMFIFTNSDMNHANRILDALGILDLFDEIVDVTRMNYLCKPDPEAFKIAMKIADIREPNECLFVDDLANNLIPAKEIGFKTALVGAVNNITEIDYTLPRLHDIEKIIPRLK